MLETNPLNPEPARAGSWRLALQNAVRDIEELAELLNIPVDDLRPECADSEEFPLLVPRSFVARMKKGDLSDPLLLQVLPQISEQADVPGFSNDPLGELSIADRGLIQKYPGRALLIASGACPVHCRYCFRRSFPYHGQLAARDNFNHALAQLDNSSGVKEVILSGGDPLSVSNDKLAVLLRALEGIETVQCVRIHTRFPIMLPERVDRGLARLLGNSSLKTVIVVHCNHANELDVEVEDALRRVSEHVDLLLNQSVLLRGINDEPTTLVELSERLFSCGVLPYYLHLLDPVAGAAHFQVDETHGQDLVATLRERLPGYLVPRLVRETPGELSKTPI